MEYEVAFRQAGQERRKRIESEGYRCWGEGQGSFAGEEDEGKDTIEERCDGTDANDGQRLEGGEHNQICMKSFI